MVAALLQVAITAMLWGAGTAMGEVPPYFISYSAAKAGKRNEMMEEVQEVSVPGGAGSGSRPLAVAARASYHTALHPYNQSFMRAVGCHLVNAQGSVLTTCCLAHAALPMLPCPCCQAHTHSCTL
jgi:hypothetical protein